MRRNWYLVAHRAGARLFEQQGVARDLSLIKQIEHPEGQLREAELASDKGGKTPQTMRTGHNQFSVEHSQRQHVAEGFARKLAHFLNEGAQKSEYDYLVLVAEPHLLGLMKKDLESSAQQKLRTTLSKDLAKIPDREIVGYLTEVLFEREPVG